MRHHISKLQTGLIVVLVAGIITLAGLTVLDRHTATTQVSGGPVAAPTAQSAATRFGAAYAQTLGGVARASALPLTDSAVRRIAANTIIPRAQRVGTMGLQGVRVSDQTATHAVAALTASDGSHQFPFAVNLTRTSAGWLVSGLQVPDIGQVLAGPAPAPAAVPAAARSLAERLTHGAKLHFGQVQHGVLPVQVGAKILMLRERAGGWQLWLTQG